jgi:hypothetical protein
MLLALVLACLATVAPQETEVRAPAASPAVQPLLDEALVFLAHSQSQAALGAAERALETARGAGSRFQGRRGQRPRLPRRAIRAAGRPTS